MNTVARIHVRIDARPRRADAQRSPGAKNRPGARAGRRRQGGS
jgi:hypothetical protein